MKKKTACIFSLVLYLLITCTILSCWVEAQMTTKVHIKELENKKGSLQFRSAVLFTDEKGQHLFEAVQGTSGLLPREIHQEKWSFNPMGGIRFDGEDPNYTMILSASRNPKEGEKIIAVEEFTEQPDQLLCLYPDGIPEELFLPKGTAILAQSETALLLEVGNAQSPFFEHAAKGMSVSLSEADRIYSLRDVITFQNALPYLVLAAVMIFAGIVLWAISCVLSIAVDSHKRAIRIIIVLTAAIFCALAILLSRIELPASLMPPDNIFDFQHYTKELVSVFYSLS